MNPVETRNLELLLAMVVIFSAVLPCLSLAFFSILRPGRTAGPIFTLYELNHVFTHKDADYHTYINIKIGSIILIWRPPFSEDRK